MPIERAILSVSDKTGILDLARALRSKGVEILSTGGTAQHLIDGGVEVTPIAKWSGAPEILGGRVKTLTPKVFGAILHDRAKPEHLADCERLGIPPVDLVVVNLYPFEATIAKEGVTVDEAIEQIDIGGPSMLRAAAKNHKHVLPLCDPSLYADFLREFEGGEIGEAFRLRCAIAVFEKTSAYDATISAFLSGAAGSQPADASRRAESPPLHLHLEKFQDLRYGENPHQTAGFYVRAGETPFTQIQGKELSYNNLLDLDAAIKLATAFTEPAIAIIKHTNPCGVGVARASGALSDALRSAIESDPVSAFGGIIGANRPFDAECTRAVADMFLEVIVAPSFGPAAREILAAKPNLRLVEDPSIASPPPAPDPLGAIRSAGGAVLVAAPDAVVDDPASWQVATTRHPTDDERRDLHLAWRLVRAATSNAIVLVRDGALIGLGSGQTSRVDAARQAVEKACAIAGEGRVRGAACASDAFYPFPDGVDVCIGAGVSAFVQPGGSMRDADVIAAAEDAGATMLLTGVRHFRH